jgi:hypothetical protein
MFVSQRETGPVFQVDGPSGEPQVFRQVREAWGITGSVAHGHHADTIRFREDVEVKTKLLAPLLSFALCVFAASAQTPPAKTPQVRPVKAGEFLVDPPTLINLGFEWVISGDDNHNAKVEVSYRKKGEATWKSAMPLMRIYHEHTYWGSAKNDDHIINVVQPNMFAGSILDLEPGTTYETRFVLSDPDGGSATHMATVSTRREPKPATGGHVYHVYPLGWKGPREPNSYIGLNCAYNYHCLGGDESFADRPRVVAGDIILVHAGIYQSFQDIYGRQSSTRPVEGTYYLFGQGTEDKPIVIKAAGDGPVVFDGRGNFTLFNVANSKYNYFEGITFRNTEIAIQAGVQFFTGAIGLTVKHCRFENINQGINDSNSGSRNFYIADNYFIGRDDPNHLQGWNGAFWDQFNFIDGQTFPVPLKSYTAVRVYGQGHVMAYNYVANFHDGIDVETYGNPDGTDAVKGPYYPPHDFLDRRTVSIDYLNNYMTNMHDNSFEIDGSMHNIRVMRNMMINSASHPFCNQPSIGGPVYWVRNIAYNAPFGAVRMSSGAPGVWFINNTIFSEFNAPTSANLHMFNNLILGENAITRNDFKEEDHPPIFQVNTYTSYDEIDYNGYRPNPGAKAAFVWNAPAPGMMQDYRELTGSIDGTGPATDPIPNSLAQHQYTTLADYSAGTHNDQHSVLVDYGDFMNVKQLDARDIKTVQKLYNADDMDFRLKPGSAPVDKGKVIPNVTDGYTGSAPDLGALEAGMPVPHYGPRPETPETE